MFHWLKHYQKSGNHLKHGRKINIYMFVITHNLIQPLCCRRATMPRKETVRKERKENGSRQKAKPSTPTQGIDARMGGEEKNIQQKEEQKKETGSGAPTQLPGPFGRLLRPAWIIRLAYSITPSLPTGLIYITKSFAFTGNLSIMSVSTRAFKSTTSTYS